MAGRRNRKHRDRAATRPPKGGDDGVASVVAEEPDPVIPEPSKEHDEGGERFGSLNWTLSLVGVVLLVFGYVLLSKANSRGDNMPATLAPFIILGSYLMIFVAIVLRTDGDSRERGSGPSVSGWRASAARGRSRASGRSQRDSSRIRAAQPPIPRTPSADGNKQ